MTNVQATGEVAQHAQTALVRIARTNMLRAITRMSYAVDRAALPAPFSIRFDTKRHAVALEFDRIPEAEAWAAELGAATVGSLIDTLADDGRRWRYYHSAATWRGFEVSVVALEPATTEQTPEASA